MKYWSGFVQLVPSGVWEVKITMKYMAIALLVVTIVALIKNLDVITIRFKQQLPPDSKKRIKGNRKELRE